MRSSSAGSWKFVEFLFNKTETSPQPGPGEGGDSSHITQIFRVSAGLDDIEGGKVQLSPYHRHLDENYG